MYSYNSRNQLFDGMQESYALRIFFLYIYNTFAVRTVGWVNLYQKFEIEKYTVCGKLILPKKIERHLKKEKNLPSWLANLHGFANICKLPVPNTF